MKKGFSQRHMRGPNRFPANKLWDGKPAPDTHLLITNTGLPSDQHAQAAQVALSTLSSEERAMFVKMLQDGAAARGVTLPEEVATQGTGPSAHLAAQQAGSAPGYARR